MDQHSPDKYLKAIGLLDKLLERPGWESSRLLTASQKRLQKIRDGLQASYDKFEQKAVADQGKAAAASDATFDDKPGMTRIYISLYQTDGARKRNWEQLLRSLTNCSVGRPIYFDEQHARQFIQSRPNLEREGYACVYIKEGDVLQTAAQPKDKNGHPLAYLQPQALQRARLVQFVHANSHRYKIVDGKLTAL